MSRESVVYVKTPRGTVYNLFFYCLNSLDYFIKEKHLGRYFGNILGPNSFPLFYFYNIVNIFCSNIKKKEDYVKQVAKKDLFLMAVLLRRGGGKGRSIEEKITLKQTFSDYF